MNTNTMPEQFDEQQDESKMTREEILMNENDILRGLLDAAKAKDNKDFYKKIEIRREGMLHFSFSIRPISEEEMLNCHRNATKYAKTKKFGTPKVAIETDTSKSRSWLVYTATIDEDRKKIWDNKKAWDALDVFTGVDLIDKVLFAGEKARVCDLIDEISGYDYDGEEAAEMAKN